jgi:hypothetical protein
MHDSFDSVNPAWWDALVHDTQGRINITLYLYDSNTCQGVYSVAFSMKNMHDSPQLFQVYFKD